MLKIKVTNHRGESITLNGNPNYTVTSITGLNPSTANINTMASANTDGSTFTNSKVNERNIVFTIVIEPKVETNRINLYKFFKVKKACLLQFENETRQVNISGYIESFDCDFYSQRETAQISILCPQPFFADIETETATITPTEETTINNYGDIETGIIITINATGSVENPIIQNTQTGDYFQILTTLSAGDVLTINSNRGHKGVTISRNGIIINAINDMERGSTWLQLDSGDNFITCDATTGAGNMKCNITYNALFEGI